METILKLPRSPITAFSFSLLIVIAVLCWLALDEIHSVQEMQHIVRADFKATELRGNILQLEEAITMSIRMAALDTDQKWVQRYELYKPKLENAIRAALAQQPLARADKAWTAANIRIQKMNLLQAQAFHLLTHHQLNAAKEIIFGTEYTHQRQHLIELMANYDRNMEAETAHHLQKKIAASFSSLVIIGSALIVVIITWVLTYRAIRRLKKITATEKRLEELLYEGQVKEIQESAPLMQKLPPEFVRLQQDRELFTKEMREALANEHFQLYFQPIIHAETNQIIEVEALMRWQHPTYGLLSPDIFIPLCESTGFIVPLGEWALKTACKQIKKWQDMGYFNLGIAINLSAAQLNKPDLLSIVSTATESFSLAPSCIKLEVTESMVMQNIETTRQLLKSLKQLGVKLSLDDFGTKYSSLTYLKEFPFDIIKIDKSFVSDMTTHDISLAIVESIAGLGKSLGLTVIAEGVDHEGQAHLLKKMQCDMLQGYLYSKPLPEKELTELLMAQQGGRMW